MQSVYFPPTVSMNVLVRWRICQLSRLLRDFLVLIYLGFVVILCDSGTSANTLCHFLREKLLLTSCLPSREQFRYCPSHKKIQYVFNHHLSFSLFYARCVHSLLCQFEAGFVVCTKVFPLSPETPHISFAATSRICVDGTTQTPKWAQTKEEITLSSKFLRHRMHVLL